MNRLDSFSWLEDWYAAQCNGDWEHGSGVKISTLDNPGWAVHINLNGTRYNEVQNWQFVDDRAPGLEWIVCEIKDGVFLGHGSPVQLGRIIQIFRKWIDNY